MQGWWDGWIFNTLERYPKRLQTQKKGKEFLHKLLVKHPGAHLPVLNYVGGILDGYVKGPLPSGKLT